MPVSTINTQQIRANAVTAAKVASDVIVAAGTNAFTADQSLGGFKLTNVGTPTANGDAANKSYVDAAVTGLLDFRGNQDCSANPNYPAASKGDAYYVSVAGKIGGASGKVVDVGDVIVASADNAGGTEAAVGTSWFVLEKNLVGALVASNNLSDLASAATARTNLGGTTIGQSVFTLTNPSAITFPRYNADNTVTAINAADMRTALGVSGGTQATRETPSGTVNGSNVTFTLANTPVSGTESVFVNGILQDSGAGNDYTISTLTITFLSGAIPQSGDKIRVSYTF